MTVELTVPIDSGHTDGDRGFYQTVTIERVQNNYLLPEGAGPIEKFQRGLKFFHNGMLESARKDISEAVVEGHRTAQTRFFLALAIMSGRTFDEVSKEEIDQLRMTQVREPTPNADDWTAGFQAICRLVEQDSDAVPGPDQELPDEMSQVSDPVRKMIDEHLVQHLKGVGADQRWRSEQARAERGQLSGARYHRAWMFFEADPVAPRVPNASPAGTSTATWMQLLGGSALLFFAWVRIGAMVFQQGDVPGVLAYLLTLIGGYVSAHYGIRWGYRIKRLREKIRQYEVCPPKSAPPPAGGFAEDVDRRFEYYFNKHTPRQLARPDWRRQTGAIQKVIRDEVVTEYRDSPTSGPAINWLIRYRVREVSRRWSDGTLWEYRTSLQVSAATKAGAVAGSLVLLLAALRALAVAGRSGPFTATGLLILAVVGGWFAALGWSRFLVHRRLFAAESAERQQLKTHCVAEFDRWLKRLRENTPHDSEMAAWLKHDRILLRQAAMRHYNLNPADVVTYAFIEAPGRGRKKAHAPGGPWRYSTYRMVVFIITSDGVRQVHANLNFEKGKFGTQDRFNYRFDAISSVGVSEKASGRRVFDLNLGGKSTEIDLTGWSESLMEADAEDPETNRVTLESSGLNRTLHILEGVAAEGKDWMSLERSRGVDRRNESLSIVRGLRENA
jgi:hypothetical protein